jgi:hypothetical protein
MTDLYPDVNTCANLAAVLSEMSPANAFDGLGQVLASVHAYVLERGLSVADADEFTTRFGREVRIRLTIGMARN